ncbi:hypothetical protein FTW19_10110 [Terriglobus albidus]|uniref:Methyl-accepting transducer domain-containing protein n=1 Tax=Terriglobus albidus TaxID=1592106 RepID=A0A5B9E968_9BACT|nr:methyl-accepting chemotaxis protein [Terriglobus albidus]QEE28319.1 hypothetical protein FTW19_10110 [Terriglobus albidus]
MNLQRYTVKQKLLISYGTMMILLVLLGGLAVYEISGLGELTWELGIKDATKMYNAGMANGHSTEMLAASRRIAVKESIGDAEGVSRAIDEYTAYEKKMREDIATILKQGVSAEGRPTLEAATTKLDMAAQLFPHYLELIRSHQVKEASQFAESQLEPALLDVDAAGSKMLERQKVVMGKANTKAEDAITFARWLIGTLLTLGAVSGVLIAFIVRLLDRQLRHAVRELSVGSDQVTEASAQVATSSQNLAKDTSEQAAMIEETSASAEEINSMARRNAENSDHSTALVSEAVRHSDDANHAVAQCVEAMDALSQSSEQIAKIIGVIDKIAFQTNILALNAAVEAARAGEAGMGFAVVAEEVRNLAQRCAQAAQETSVLIKNSVDNTAAGRERMTTLVDSGRKVHEVFGRIKVMIDEIRMSSQEQGKGIDQISRAIGRMESGTQKNAANAEESAAAAQELNAQSDALRGVATGLARMTGVPVRGHSQKAVVTPVLKPVKAPVLRPAIAKAPAVNTFVPQRLAPAAASNIDANFTDF